MRDLSEAKIMHWMDWEHMVTICKAIEHDGGHDEVYPIQGSTIIQLCQLVLNNGQGIYSFEDELGPEEEEWLERASIWRNQQLYGKNQKHDFKDTEL